MPPQPPLRVDHPLRAMGAPFGVAAHTTGRDDKIEARILRDKRDAGEVYADIYRASEFYPAYVIGHDGREFAIASEQRRLPHIGCKEGQREQFLSGRWETEFLLYDGERKAADLALVARWKARWPGFRSPQHLFPGPSPNDAYIGVEMTPVFPGCGFEPMRPGLAFTRAQHDRLAQLTLAASHRWRWKIPAAKSPTGVELDWHCSAERMPNRLLGHEDANPMDRPGWDPGALLAVPAFDWRYVFARIADLALPF